jgi:aryl-alcohol dehydrogenase-like predicted oxidoreductase
MSDKTYPLAGRRVHRMGFGAMKLPGPGVFGPPRDRQQALAVLRQAVEAGVNHIDTAYYGLGIANELIHAALHPYPDGLVIVSKVGAARDGDGGLHDAQSPEERSDQAVFDACAADGVPYVPFFPLGSAFGSTNPVLAAPAVVAAASRVGVTPAQVALAWLLQRSPNVLLIPGTSSLGHLKENLEAADLTLDSQALDEIGAR